MTKNILSYMGAIFYDLPHFVYMDENYRCAYVPEMELLCIRLKGNVAIFSKELVEFHYNPINDTSYNFLRIPLRYRVSFMIAMDGNFSKLSNEFKSEFAEKFPMVAPHLRERKVLQVIPENLQGMMQSPTELLEKPSILTRDIYYQLCR